MGVSDFGVYDGRQIQVNQDHLASSERFWEILDTLIHEDRHAYQHWSLITPGFHSDPGQVRAWADNWENYLDPKEVLFGGIGHSLLKMTHSGSPKASSWES